MSSWSELRVVGVARLEPLLLLLPGTVPAGNAVRMLHIEGLAVLGREGASWVVVVLWTEWLGAASSTGACMEVVGLPPIPPPRV